MPKLGMEPIRRDALVKATIHEIGAAGTLDVTVSQIARRAGVSSALAHHYFGGKDQIFLAAMREILREFGAEVRAALSTAKGPRQRLQAIVTASFAPSCFDQPVIGAWMRFYARAHEDVGARRLLEIYQARLRSNLTHAFRPLTDRPEAAAETLAALIDGLYLRAALGDGADHARDTALSLADRLTEPHP
ncbi:MAG: transcriptional regulator BetI [Pseudomonadota bacterium]